MTSADPWWTCSGYGTAEPKTIANDATKANIAEEIEEFAVSNFPNPFNPSTHINYALPEAAYVSLVIYDVLGREVASLANGYHGAGYYSVIWNASSAASGLYFARLRVTDDLGRVKFSKVNKLLLAK
jgi:hypothetical protein